MSEYIMARMNTKWKNPDDKPLLTKICGVNDLLKTDYIKYYPGAPISKHIIVTWSPYDGADEELWVALVMSIARSMIREQKNYTLTPVVAVYISDEEHSFEVALKNTSLCKHIRCISYNNSNDIKMDESDSACISPDDELVGVIFGTSDKFDDAINMNKSIVDKLVTYDNRKVLLDMDMVKSLPMCKIFLTNMRFFERYDRCDMMYTGFANEMNICGSDL